MKTKVQKWGNSLGVRLPKEAADKLKLSEGSQVAVEAGRESIQIKPLGDGPVQIAKLVKEISAANRHKAFDWGSPAGNETW